MLYMHFQSQKVQGKIVYEPDEQNLYKLSQEFVVFIAIVFFLEITHEFVHKLNLN